MIISIINNLILVSEYENTSFQVFILSLLAGFILAMVIKKGGVINVFF